MIIFQPRMLRQTYAKQYLHADEYPYFVGGQEQMILRRENHTIAPAICYELSVPEHSSNAFKLGAGIYIASVAKTAAGVDKAHKDLAGIALNYSMTVLLSNCVGTCDGVECGGRTSAWNNKRSNCTRATIPNTVPATFNPFACEFIAPSFRGCTDGIASRIC